MSAWKVASGELENDPLTERMVDTGLPILLSTGMHALPDVDRRRRGLAAAPPPVRACCSARPCIRVRPSASA